MGRVIPKLDLYTAGTLISGRYRIIDTIGSGAVGTVLRASDLELDGEVTALKVLHPHLATNKEALGRFQNEVFIGRQLSHPNIVRIFDFDGTDEAGFYFLSMECICGPNLREYTSVYKGRKLAAADAARIMHHLASALSFAHQKGVIHRDIKPENIMLGPDGEAKLGDFGLAYSLQSSIGLTATGEALGTSAYMPPEMFRGEKPDARSDLYSLGVLAYELASGALPFRDQTFFALAERHLNEEFPEEPLASAAVPSWYIELIRRCAAKNRSDRFQSAQEVVEFIRERSPDTLIQPKLKVRPARFKAYVIPRRSRIVGRLILAAISLSIAGFVFDKGNYGPRKNFLHSVYKIEKTFGIDASRFKEFTGFPTVSPLDRQALCQAVAKRDGVLLRALLWSRANVHCLDENGNNPAHLIVQKSNPQFLNELKPYVEQDFFDKLNAAGSAPIHLALREHKRSAFQGLLLVGADPNTQDAQGNTVLHLAADLDMVDYLGDLLSAKKTVKGFLRNGRGETPLHVAAKNCAVRAAEHLIAFWSDANSRDAHGRTPLMVLLASKAAAKAPPGELQKMIGLLLAGSHSRERDHYGHTVEDYARQYGKEEALKQAELSLGRTGQEAAVEDPFPASVP